MLLFALLLLLAGCNTIAGAGRDLIALGELMSKAEGETSP